MAGIEEYKDFLYSKRDYSAYKQNKLDYLTHDIFVKEYCKILNSMKPKIKIIASEKTSSKELSSLKA